jgi:hypothetical protein
MNTCVFLSITTDCRRIIIPQWQEISRFPEGPVIRNSQANSKKDVTVHHLINFLCSLLNHYHLPKFSSSVVILKINDLYLLRRKMMTLKEVLVESWPHPWWPSNQLGVLHHLLYSRYLYISCYLSDNKPGLSYLLLCLLPQWWPRSGCTLCIVHCNFVHSHVGSHQCQSLSLPPS